MLRILSRYLALNATNNLCMWYGSIDIATEKSTVFLVAESVLGNIQSKMPLQSGIF